MRRHSASLRSHVVTKKSLILYTVLSAFFIAKVNFYHGYRDMAIGTSPHTRRKWTVLKFDPHLNNQVIHFKSSSHYKLNERFGFRGS